MRKAPKGGDLHPIDEQINHLIAKVRSRVEHPFRVLKRQFGYIKTRYRGLAKNRAQLFSLFALGNLYLVRRRLMARRVESAENTGALGKGVGKSPEPRRNRPNQVNIRSKRLNSDVDQTFLRGIRRLEFENSRQLAQHGKVLAS